MPTLHPLKNTYLAIMAKAAKKPKKKTAKKEPINMSFEEAVRLSIHTKIPKKKKV